MKAAPAILALILLLSTAMQGQAGSSSGDVFVAVPVLGWYVVFGHFARTHLREIGSLAVFDAVNGIGLEGISFLYQFLHAFGICVWGI